ncbi:hypothetical protein H9P43_008067 [Blastocladiella emersonii ATCC 22665]|nr:hypothetical protein H9P43_008067 [Blastocladiella emersonii ATCC 22665]
MSSLHDPSAVDAAQLQRVARVCYDSPFVLMRSDSLSVCYSKHVPQEKLKIHAHTAFDLMGACGRHKEGVVSYYFFPWKLAHARRHPPASLDLRIQYLGWPVKYLVKEFLVLYRLVYGDLDSDDAVRARLVALCAAAGPGKVQMPGSLWTSRFAWPEPSAEPRAFEWPAGTAPGEPMLMGARWKIVPLADGAGRKRAASASAQKQQHQGYNGGTDENFIALDSDSESDSNASTSASAHSRLTHSSSSPSLPVSYASSKSASPLHPPTPLLTTDPRPGLPPMHKLLRAMCDRRRRVERNRNGDMDIDSPALGVRHRESEAELRARDTTRAAWSMPRRKLVASDFFVRVA